MPFIRDTSGLSSECYSESYTEWESNDETGGGTTFQSLSRTSFQSLSFSHYFSF